MSDRKKEQDKTRNTAATALASLETVERHGSANAEYIKGYTGMDRETGKVFAKGLKKISEHKVHPDYAEQNIKQQAGFSAEVAKTSRDNAENIINKSARRTARTDDVIGVNHPVYDLVEMEGGQIIAGSGSQMKFVTHPDQLVDRIAKGQGDGKTDLSRYVDAKLDLPSEQIASVKAHCQQQSQSLLKQAERLEREGKPELAAQKRQQAKNYQKIEGNIRDSGLTTEEAIYYRKHPTIATVRDIASVSHRAGVEGAKFGAAIGGGIAVITNTLAVYQDDKEVKEALLDVARETGKSAAVGYGTAFVGSAAKGAMQQSRYGAVQALSKTALPTLAVSVCLEVGVSIKHLATGQIDGVRFMEEIGEKGAGMLASGMMATLGQIAIPIPVVGGVIGGMIGYTLSSMFYQESLNAFKAAKQAHADYLRIEAQCEEARVQMLAYQRELQILFDAHMADTRATLDGLFAQMDGAVETPGRMDDFCAAANRLGEVLGKRLQFNSMSEFEAFMDSDEVLVL
jgi:hypothetical protein